MRNVVNDYAPFASYAQAKDIGRGIARERYPEVGNTFNGEGVFKGALTFRECIGGNNSARGTECNGTFTPQVSVNDTDSFILRGKGIGKYRWSYSDRSN
jgi:hypothetical protein